MRGSTTVAALVALLLVVLSGTASARVTAADVASVAGGACAGEDVGAVEAVSACGDVVLSGRGGTHLRLDLPAAAEIKLNACHKGVMRYGVPTSHSCAVDADGDSPMIGVVIVDHTRTYSFAGLTHPASLLLAEHAADEWQTVTNEVAVNNGFDEVVRDGVHFVMLAAGSYDLHLVGGTGDDVEVTLRLEGLSGSVRVTPEAVTEGYEYVVPQNELPSLDNSNWSAGHEFTSTGSALTFYEHMVDSPVNVALLQGQCVYNGPLAQRSLAYRPGCPDHYLGSPEDSGQGRVPAVNPALAGLDRVYVVRPAGTWPMGAWHHGAAPLAFAGDVGFIVPLD